MKDTFGFQVDSRSGSMSITSGEWGEWGEGGEGGEVVGFVPRDWICSSSSFVVFTWNI